MNCGFTLNHYKEIIELAKDEGYTITPTIGYLDELKKPLLLRHDIDFSIEMAYEMANFEYDLGICSSYYVMLHSPTYNALAPDSIEMIRQMYKMGHEIGLHYDSRYSMSFETDILSRINMKAIYSYTQHAPGLTKKEEYQTLVDPNDLDLKYISDSGRNWREGCVCQHIGKDKKLHVLIHPVWWITESKDRQDAIHKLWLSFQDKTVKDVKDIKQLLYEYYRDDLKMGGS